MVLFPDLGQYEKWMGKAQRIQKNISCKIIVSDLLEKNAGGEERAKGWDLADYLLANTSKR